MKGRYLGKGNTSTISFTCSDDDDEKVRDLLRRTFEEIIAFATDVDCDPGVCFRAWGEHLCGSGTRGNQVNILSVELLRNDS